MIQFDIPGMTCGGCARSLTKAIHSIDADARVVPDIPARRVTIESSHDRAKFVEAIRAAGYDMQPA